ncbi:hypothetical protein CAPTEDRAFT_204187 [Capitella teleta]|uniref:Uncharacterized protein n=1 Tax=Capitella teleta TaxID=283909 RepID=R7USC8_CAPTE|nr:hypothetical protein CAPTEDRAFT_204187 [Capitella teleta]|eukprot:ELU06316.1 hypothetical protein CAPTEDRAFT_204187 [Capitella teleta]
MVRVFGGEVKEGNVGLDTGPSGLWTSPHPVSRVKPEHWTPADPYNLSPPYTWWTTGISNEFIDPVSGEEIVRLVNTHNKRQVEKAIKYADIRNCTDHKSVLKLILPRSIKGFYTSDGMLKLRNMARGTNMIQLLGMPCDIVTKALGVETANSWSTLLPRTMMQIQLDFFGSEEKIMPVKPSFTPRKWMLVSDIVEAVADREQDAVRFDMKYNRHVQGFSMVFPATSPFYPFVKVSIGVLGDDSYVPPPGVPNSMVMLNGTEVEMKGAGEERDDKKEKDDNKDETSEVPPTTLQPYHLAPDDILPFEPFKLRGLIPHCPSAHLMLRKDWKRKSPVSGYRVRVAARRNMPLEEWTGKWSKKNTYAFNDITGDLPFPACYQTSDALIAAIQQTSSKEHIAKVLFDFYTSVEITTARDTLWEKAEESILLRLIRRHSVASEKGAMSTINDTMEAMKCLHQADKMPLSAVPYDKLRRIPLVKPSETATASLCERLNMLEARMEKHERLIAENSSSHCSEYSARATSLDFSVDVCTEQQSLLPLTNPRHVHVLLLKDPGSKQHGEPDENGFQMVTKQKRRPQKCVTGTRVTDGSSPVALNQAANARSRAHLILLSS